MFGIFDVPVAGAYHLVMSLSGLIAPALTIVGVTIAVRLMLHPLARAAGVMRLLPYFSILGAAMIPLAAGVYLLTTTAWATAERAYLRKVYFQGT